ncbi:MAG: GGDEF domain-containing protein [Eubacteriales bacterium]|nr:GGDEF domain-containing protein [Eubacteriales bacterium]
MHKKIAFLVGEIAWEYQHTVSESITKSANKLGYDVVTFCSYGCYFESHYLYAEGEKSCIHIPDFSMFDGIIVTEDVFDIPGMADELYDLLKKTATCPIIYMRTQRDNCYSILLENTTSIENMVRHFTDVHGFTDICYMSGKEGIVDTAERLQGYLNVMKEKNIPVTEHMIFHGDFWRNKGEEAMNWFMTDRDTYPQAIVCANDYMAFSICEELRKRNVRIPEDVCVSGFDFIDEAKTYEPTLTSLEIDFETMAERAVEIIDNIAHNKEEAEYINRIEAKTRLHKSCGCGEQYQFKNITDYLDGDHHHISDTKNIFLSSIDYQDAFEFDEYMNVADKYRWFIRSDKAYFCFLDSDEQGADAIENDSSFTNHMVLKQVFEKDQPAKKLNVKFPRRNILPDECWSDDEPNNYFIFTIHFKNLVYGYMAATIPSTGWFDIYTQGFLMTLANAIENGQTHKQMAHLEEIRSLYQKDPLTGIFNRRGFDKLLQENIVSARLNGNNFGIVSIDMDNLKTINDTYGHAEGDRAIITLANALNSIMKPGDFCARIGGDEFSAFISLPTPNRAKEFRNELNDALERENASLSNYQVGASVGICELAEDPSASLIACIQTADMRMYENKRARKKDVR